jgi:hypothetical protein
MKLKVRELKQIIKETIKLQGLDGFRRSESFKSQLESILNTLNEFSGKTPVGFFDAYNKEYEVDFYKSFHDFYEGVSEVYDNLFKTGREVHVGDKEDSGNIESTVKTNSDELKTDNEQLPEEMERDVQESKVNEGAEPDLASWGKDRIENCWDTLKKDYKTRDAKISALSKFTSNPETFLNALEKRATGENSKKRGG